MPVDLVRIQRRVLGHREAQFPVLFVEQVSDVALLGLRRKVL